MEGTCRNILTQATTSKTFAFQCKSPASPASPTLPTWRELRDCPPEPSRFGSPGPYFDNYQRAQLRAILSQVNPGLTPRLRKANTKEVGVQVNPRQDAAVQCSLGPRTLPPRRRPADTRAVRFPRTIAVYSPVASRRLTAFLEEPGAEAERPRRRRAAPRGSAQPRAHGPCPSRQFLEQKYGYYHCKDCNIRWESAYVWCVQGTNKVYFRQFCRTCQKSYNPYRVEDITCQSCKQTRCTCPVKMRHVDPKRPHRQDLCGRCKGKRLSCDSTFSFKYII
uniref:Zygote arrest 1 n=1 Tax=Nothoprocta perdicaria TaxID=30464 RepID=A0A8C6Z0G2_NOTPE